MRGSRPARARHQLIRTSPDEGKEETGGPCSPGAEDPPELGRRPRLSQAVCPPRDHALGLRPPLHVLSPRRVAHRACRSRLPQVQSLGRTNIDLRRTLSSIPGTTPSLASAGHASRTPRSPRRAQLIARAALPANRRRIGLDDGVPPSIGRRAFGISLPRPPSRPRLLSVESHSASRADLDPTPAEHSARSRSLLLWFRFVRLL